MSPPDGARVGAAPREECAAPHEEGAAPQEEGAAPQEVGLFLDGLRCAGCAHRVEQELRAATGVIEASVNYTTNRALVRFDPGCIDRDGLAARVADLGYQATPYDPRSLDRPAQLDQRRALVRLLVAAFLAGNVMVVAVALYIGSYQEMSDGVRRALRFLAIALSVPAITYCAAPFWRGAWSGLRRGTLTVDVPVVLGVAAAFGASVLGTVTGTRHVFADSAAMIVFLILLGRTLEGGARGRAAAAVERLLEQTPPTATRRTAGGLEEVPAASLEAGDRIVIPAGQVIPVDGRIVWGETEVDESLLTGESVPVLRGLGATVTGGTRNLQGEVEAEVLSAAHQGTLARLAALLERAQAERPRIQRSADRVARVFAPGVLLVAAAACLWSASTGAGLLDTALTTAAVLIVACPCALALATPAAVTAALGRAAAIGILFKSGEALERCATVDRALLDKTGTVTQGVLEVSDVRPAPGVTERDVLRVAAAVEGASTHPVGDAIRRRAADLELRVDEYESRESRPGLGVVAGDACTGSRALLGERGVEIDPLLARSAAKLAKQGRTLAWVARGRAALGVIGLADLPRPDAAEAIRRLRALGISAAIVSGDHTQAASQAAALAGIGEVHAELTPDQKVDVIRRERASGARVLMAGDGINDAAAMGAADVGLAFARGADVAVLAADIVLHAPRLMAVPAAVALSRVTLRRIRQNLGFAVTYNVVAVPLAVTGVLEPIHAAIAMSLSSLVVTGNAIRLLAWRPPW